jgi:hypothetical protein
MIKTYLLILWGFAILSCSKEQIKIVERSSAMLIEPGYYVSESDSTFVFRGHKYLIKTKAFFDDREEIDHVLLWKSEGYLAFSKKEFSKLRGFLEEHDFSKTIEADIIDDYHISLNSKIIKVDTIDKAHKEIYYKVSSKKEILYRLLYK